MNPTPAIGALEWLENAWPVRLTMILIGVELWPWATAWSVRDRLRRLRWRLAAEGEQP